MSWFDIKKSQDLEQKIKARLLQLTKAYYRKELDDALMDAVIPEIGSDVSELVQIVDKECSRSSPACTWPSKSPLPCGCTPGWCNCGDV